MADSSPNAASLLKNLSAATPVEARTADRRTLDHSLQLLQDLSLSNQSLSKEVERLNGAVEGTVDYRLSLADLAATIDSADQEISKVLLQTQAVDAELEAVERDVGEVDRQIGEVEQTIRDSAQAAKALDLRPSPDSSRSGSLLITLLLAVLVLLVPVTLLRSLVTHTLLPYTYAV